MEVDPPPVLPSFNFLNPSNLNPSDLKRQRSASAEENEKKRSFAGRAYDDILEDMFLRFRLVMVACLDQAPTVHEFAYNGKNRRKEPDVIKLFFRLQIVDTSEGRKAALSFYMDDRYGTIDTRSQFQELGLSTTVSIKCGLTLREIKLAFQLHESALRKTVTDWLNFAEALYS